MTSVWDLILEVREDEWLLLKVFTGRGCKGLKEEASSKTQRIALKWLLPCHYYASLHIPKMAAPQEVGHACRKAIKPSVSSFFFKLGRASALNFNYFPNYSRLTLSLCKILSFWFGNRGKPFCLTDFNSFWIGSSPSRVLMNTNKRNGPFDWNDPDVSMSRLAARGFDSPPCKWRVAPLCTIHRMKLNRTVPVSLFWH